MGLEAKRTCRAVRRQNRKDAVLVREAAVEGADRRSATETASPAPAIIVNPYVIRIYDTTKPNKVGLSVIQITNLSKQFK